jgi:hypothetical protein
MMRSKEHSYSRAPIATVPVWHTCVALSVLLAFLCGVLILYRRATGAFDAALPPTLLLPTAMLLAAWLAIVSDHWLEHPAKSTRSRIMWNQISVGCAWASLTLFAVGCSFPFGRLIDWLIWPLAFAAAWFSPGLLHNLREQSFSPQRLRRNPRPAAALANANDVIPLQRATRYRAHDGAETIHALLRVDFSPGERDATAYVAFCPPFNKFPTVEAFLTDDIAADVNLTQVLHHGAQVEIRLPTPARLRTAVNVELIAADSEAAPSKS